MATVREMAHMLVNGWKHGKLPYLMYDSIAKSDNSNTTKSNMIDISSIYKLLVTWKLINVIIQKMALQEMEPELLVDLDANQAMESLFYEIHLLELTG